MSDVIEREPEITWTEAEQSLLRTMDRFQRGDVDGLVSRYADDILVIFAGMEVRGKQAAEKFFRARFAKQRNYRLVKTLFSVTGQKIANTWTGHWEDTETGKAMEGYGVEVLELRGGKVIRWEAAFNVWEAGNQAASRYFQLE